MKCYRWTRRNQSFQTLFRDLREPTTVSFEAFLVNLKQIGILCLTSASTSTSETTSVSIWFVPGVFIYEVKRLSSLP